MVKKRFIELELKNIIHNAKLLLEFEKLFLLEEVPTYKAIIMSEYDLIKLEKDLRNKEQRLQETRTLKFKLWFVARLLWTYIKSAILSIFLIGFIWGGIYFCVYSLYGRSAGISLLDDPAFGNSYLVATFVISPILFIIRRAYIILKKVRLLHSDISSLKKQIEERKEIIAERERQLQDEQRKREENPNNNNETRKQTHISGNVVEVKQVYFLPTKIINKTINKKIVRKCRICGTEIDELEYENYKGLCHACWKRCQEIEGPERDPVREARRAGLLGADRASTW